MRAELALSLTVGENIFAGTILAFVNREKMSPFKISAKIEIACVNEILLLFL